MMLSYGARPKDSLSALPSLHTFITSSRDGKTWKQSALSNLPGEWAWHIAWYNGSAYTVAYTMNDKPKLYSSKDGIHYKFLSELNVPGFSTETVIQFTAEGKMVAIVRCDTTDRMSYYGESVAPFTSWKLRPMQYRFGGPNITFLPDNTCLITGRTYSNGNASTMLGIANQKGDILNVLNLPSSGDTGYAGVVWLNNILWVSYYSSHEGQPKIYLAKVKFKDKRLSMR
jgi:hypothetical protein